MHVLVLAAERSSMTAIVDLIGIHRPKCCTDPATALAKLASAPPDVVVLDADGWTDEVFTTLCEALARSSATVIYYTKLQPSNAARAVEMASARPVHVVLRGSEDESLVLRHAVLNAANRAIPAALLADVAPRLKELPAGLQARSVEMFGTGRIPRWVGALQLGSGVGRRSVDRWMDRAGLPSAGVVLDVARLARAWHMVVDEAMPIEQVSDRLGYGRVRTFNDHLVRYLGTTPTAMGKTFKGKETLARLRAELRRK